MTSKGQITLPIEVRRKLGLEAGTRLNVVVIDDARVELVPVRHSIRSMKGMLPKPDKPVTFEDMEAGIIEGATSWSD
jgi:AbrB family looped-hinge helix DNA binding protein